MRSQCKRNLCIVKKMTYADMNRHNRFGTVWVRGSPTFRSTALWTCGEVQRGRVLVAVDRRRWRRRQWMDGTVGVTTGAWRRRSADASPGSAGDVVRWVLTASRRDGRPRRSSAVVGSSKAARSSTNSSYHGGRPTASATIASLAHRCRRRTRMVATGRGRQGGWSVAAMAER